MPCRTSSFQFIGGVIMLMAAGIMFGGCGRDEPTEPSDPLSLWKSLPNHQIVFLSRADHPAGELYRINKAGDIYRLTDNDRHENNPAISADGLHVAFHAGQEDNPLTWDIIRLEIATKREVRLTVVDSSGWDLRAWCRAGATYTLWSTSTGNRAN